MKITSLPASGFSRRPWKNGLGETVTIASRTSGEGWQDVEWSLSRTTIEAAGPFSDFSGYERWQVVTEGTGLVLETPEGEIDLRRPFRPVRYDGALAARARLESGKVGVVNLIARKNRYVISMIALAEGEEAQRSGGLHLLFAPVGDCRVLLADQAFALGAGDALRIETDAPLEISNGVAPVILASIGERGDFGA